MAAAWIEAASGHGGDEGVQFGRVLRVAAAGVDDEASREELAGERQIATERVDHIVTLGDLQVDDQQCPRGVGECLADEAGHLHEAAAPE